MKKTSILAACVVCVMAGMLIQCVRAGFGPTDAKAASPAMVVFEGTIAQDGGSEICDARWSFDRPPMVNLWLLSDDRWFSSNAPPLLANGCILVWAGSPGTDYRLLVIPQ